MSRNQKGNKESKKKPLLTLKEKRAAKRAKDSDIALLGSVFDKDKHPHHHHHRH